MLPLHLQQIAILILIVTVIFHSVTFTHTGMVQFDALQFYNIDTQHWQTLWVFGTYVVQSIVRGFRISRI